MTDSGEETSILLELVRKRYGNRLSEEQLDAVEKQIKNNLESAEKLHSVKLGNEDEPYNVFKPYRSEQ